MALGSQDDFVLKTFLDMHKAVLGTMLLTEYNEVEREEFYIKKGMEKGILSSISNLMQSSHMTSEQAMKLLLIPETKWAYYIEQLKELPKSTV